MNLTWVLLSANAAFGAQPQIPQRLTLREAQEIAVNNHPAIRAARFSSLAAAEAPAQIGAARHPTVTGSLTGAGAPENSRLAAGGLNNPVIYSRLASGFSINQLLFDFGRTSHLMDGARYRAQAEDQSATAVRNQVILEVDRAYFNVLRADSVLRVAQQTADSRQLVLDQISELEKAGLKSGLDRSFAEVSLAEARLLIATAENDKLGAFANLEAALGRPLGILVELADEPFQIEPLVLSELLERARRERPDLHARRLDAQASARFTQAEKALRYPSVSAMASAGWLPEHHSALNGRYSAAGLNVNLPFLNGGLFKSRQNEAKMRELAAQERVNDLETRIVRDVTVALLNINNAAERVSLTQRLLQQADMAVELAQSRYDLGLSSIVELSQAQLARTSAAIQNVNAKYDYQFQRSLLNYQTAQR